MFNKNEIMNKGFGYHLPGVTGSQSVDSTYDLCG